MYRYPTPGTLRITAVSSPSQQPSADDPLRVAGQSPAYARRVYATPAGLSGVPPLDDVISALTAARNREPTWPDECVSEDPARNHQLRRSLHTV
jgi:hypothetical protein